MIGGLVKDQVLRQTFMLDENLNYKEIALMNVARFCAPVTLLKDSFILVAGGQTSASNRTTYTSSTEIFSIATSTWTTISSLQKPRGNTSLCQIADRYVYIFNGVSAISF
jgi:hypothetical protein